MGKAFKRSAALPKRRFKPARIKPEPKEPGPGTEFKPSFLKEAFYKTTPKIIKGATEGIFEPFVGKEWGAKAGEWAEWAWKQQYRLPHPGMTQEQAYYYSL
jgi:hypothetical protein